MTVKDLKNALLQEAVQGKLVPQIVSEGNARDLIDEIKYQKKKLIKEGKIKKEKSLPVITEDEIPFDIPENWCWCRLSDLGEFTRGSGIKRDETTKEGFPCVRYGEMYTTYKIRFSQTKSFTSKEVFDKCHKIHTNDVLMALTGENKWDIALAATYEGSDELALGGDLCKFTPYKCDPLFLVYLINSPYGIEYKRNTSTGDIIVHTSTTKLGNFLIPLPPLSEQKRIVSAIEKFMPLIEEYGKKETILNQLNTQIGTLTKKAILQEAVQGKLVPQIANEGNANDLLEKIKNEKIKLIKEGKIKKEKPLPVITEDEIPFDIPENWCWCRLADFCNLYTGNSINEIEKKTKYTNIKDGRYYIGTKDVSFDSVITYDNGVKIPFENDNFRVANTNTILMCIEGGSAGRKIAFTNQPVCFGNKLCCFDAYKKESIQFLYYFMQSTLFTDLFKNNMSGIIGGVSVNTLKAMLIPLPPLFEQKRIVAAIEQLLPLCEKLGN